MKILFAASEVYPHAKTGGLADVAAALTNELVQLGQDVKLLLPGYPQLVEKLALKKRGQFDFHIGGVLNYSLEVGQLPRCAADVILIRADRIYDSCDLYGGPRFKQFLKFFTLSHAAAMIASHAEIIGWKAEILHANDWHSGLCFQILDALNENAVARVFTIHNIAFSGRFPSSYLRIAEEHVEKCAGALFTHKNEFSFLEEAILKADKLNTVSPNYAEEIQGKQFGFGFERILKKRKRDLFGILNGVDYNIWHPEQDRFLTTRSHTFSRNDKTEEKRRLQYRYGLPCDEKAILCSFTNRLTHQKMIDVIINAINKFKTEGFQFIFHGKGETAYEAALKHLSSRSDVAYIPGFEEKIEHQLLAGADICLTPSRFEPCGLNALYGMRYGALPLARPIGGYRNTIADAFKSHAKGAGNGFFMPAESPDAFIHSLKRIKSLYRNEAYWDQLVENAKSRHFSWGDTARNYLSLYNLAVRKRRSERDFAPQRARPDLAPPQSIAS